MYRHIHIGCRYFERPSMLWIYIQAKTLKKGLLGLETSEISCCFLGPDR